MPILRGTYYDSPAQDELNGVVDRRYSVGFSNCEMCNTRLLRTKFSVVDGLLLCAFCEHAYKANKDIINGR